MKTFFTKQRLPLILAVGVPAAFLVIVFALTWLPTLLAHPKYDLIYYSYNGGSYGQNFDMAYTVKDGKLTRDCRWPSYYRPLSAQSATNNIGTAPSAATKTTACDDIYSSLVFYRLNVATKQSTRVTEQQVMALRLSNERTSPDGYELQQPGYSGGPFTNAYADTDNYYLVGNGARIKVGHLNSQTSSYGNNPFVGWVQYGN